MGLSSGLCMEVKISNNVFWQASAVGLPERAAALGQEACCVWFTGLSGSGKSTLANALEVALHKAGRHVYVLDGDNIRHGLNRDLGFSVEDRIENIRRVAEVARLMVDAGLIVLVAFISPFRAERAMARGLFLPRQFVEVFVDSPLTVCEQRDTKGLYARARLGELRDFTGIDSPYEVPLAPEVHVDTSQQSLEECLAKIRVVVDAA